jgi:hypothetical protein
MMTDDQVLEICKKILTEAGFPPLEPIWENNSYKFLLNGYSQVVRVIPSKKTISVYRIDSKLQNCFFQEFGNTNWSVCVE